MIRSRPICARDRDAIIQSLAAGVTPRVGLQHIQVGRAREVEALLQDVDRITAGGSSVRFVIGEYGAGKTFFLSLVRLVALERRCVTIHADLAPDRRLHGSAGQARALYAEAVRNMATRSKPDGNGLASVVERFLGTCTQKAAVDGATVETIVEGELSAVQDLTGGYDFALVLTRYWQAHEAGDDALKSAALRWLRGEYATKTDARRALGVRSIIDDTNIYDSLKCLAELVRRSGYAGLVVMFDEMVNVYKLQSSQARAQNFEQILHMLNDSLQGSSIGLGFVFGGTPEFLMDPRRGLYSYEALQSRLAENSFAANGLVDLSGPVVRLQNLSPEEMLILLENIRHVFAGGDRGQYLVPDEALIQFMEHCNRRIGETYFRTPRSTIKAFVQLLAVLQQNPLARWDSLLGKLSLQNSAERSGAGDRDLSRLTF